MESRESLLFNTFVLYLLFDSCQYFVLVLCIISLEILSFIRRICETGNPDSRSPLSI